MAQQTNMVGVAISKTVVKMVKITANILLGVAFIKWVVILSTIATNMFKRAVLGGTTVLIKENTGLQFASSFMHKYIHSFFW